MSPRPPLRTSPRTARKRGQVLVFMALVVVMIAFVSLFYFDLNKILHVKGVSRNAGDAAALSAARWQAISLNLIGSLNVAQASALTDALSDGLPSSPESDTIAELQRRITFSGPIYGLLAAQQAAKKNGLHNLESTPGNYTHTISTYRTLYARDYGDPFQPSGAFPSAWHELADMYQLIMEHGVAVNPLWDFYRHYVHYNHLLLNQNFYDAIAGRNWCWFYHNAYGELRYYRSYEDWEDLPDREYDRNRQNPESLGMHLRRWRVRDFVPVLPEGTQWEPDLEDLAEELTRTWLANWETFVQVDVDWSLYRSGRWTGWTPGISEGFPWAGDVREEYDFMGADVVMTVAARTERRSVFRRSGQSAVEEDVSWLSAARPFGTLEGEEGPVPPHTFGIVLPAYTDVRLIPLDTTRAGANSQIPGHPGWQTFITSILPRYMELGPSVLVGSGNFYAQRLLVWESREFRQRGVEWLEVHSDRCNRQSTGGSGGGGTRFGH